MNLKEKIIIEKKGKRRIVVDMAVCPKSRMSMKIPNEAVGGRGSALWPIRFRFFCFFLGGGDIIFVT